MINIIDKSKCCGCSACVQVCPKQCIQMHEDNEGFLYPQVNAEICIHCGLCEKVCPELHTSKKCEPLSVYAAKNTDEEVRLTSSSGGIFTLLAEQIIEEGGVVFGARFDEKWEVHHIMATTKEELKPFRGSKYVQSRIGTTFKQVKVCLNLGKKVLFTGAPCQVAGLKHYLRKDYDNLLTMDFVCHGVPSPKVWRSYLSEVSEGRNIKNIEFRNKRCGWKNPSLVLDFEEIEKRRLLSQSRGFDENIFMQAFLSNLILRPSCYDCAEKCGKSGSDITLGDFWGIEKVLSNFDDDRGCSLLLIYSSKVLKYLNCPKIAVSMADALAKNQSILYSVNVPMNREYFFYAFGKKGNFYLSYAKTVNMNLFFRFRRFIYRKLRK